MATMICSISSSRQCSIPLNTHTKKYTDFLVKIEINKEIESLNISNSAAIAFHHIMKRKKDLD